MPTVRSIITDALTEIGAYGVGEVPSGSDMELGLRRFQNQIDAWAADRLTLSVQSRTAITWPAATSTRTIGPGGQIDTQRPVWINQMTYVNPGSTPTVEVVMGPMDDQSYALQSIKGLQSGLPRQYFYQTSIDTLLGSLFIWPQPTGSITLYLYAPQAVGVPTGFDDILLGPPGYQDAFMYALAERLLVPFAIGNPAVVAMVQSAAQRSMMVMKRPNVDPGLLGVDAALTLGTSAGYNILTDSQSAPGGR